MENDKLIKQIVQCAYDVRGILQGGYLESVYHNALVHELRLKGLMAISEAPINVVYKDIVVGEFKADIIIENKVIVEIKAVETLNKIHEVQLVNYLTATGIDDGLLINFGNSLEIKRKFRLYTPTKRY